MAGIRIEGDQSLNLANSEYDDLIDQNVLKINLSKFPKLSGYLNLLSNRNFDPLSNNLYDNSSIGIKNKLSPNTSQDYRLSTSLDYLMFNENFISTITNTSLWKYNSLNMTPLQNGNFNLNSTSNTSSGSYSILTTYRNFPIFDRTQLIFSTSVKISSISGTNSIMEMGLGFVAATSAPTDGIYFRLKNNIIYSVINFNGQEITYNLSDTSTTFQNSLNKVVEYKIFADNSKAFFLINDTIVGIVDIRNGINLAASCSEQLPIFYRVYNSALTDIAPNIIIYNSSIYSGDLNNRKSHSHILSGMGRSSSLNQTGLSPGQTASWSNSIGPNPFTPSNTSSDLDSLGGTYILNINTLAINTDYILQSYKIPLSGINSGLCITDISISAMTDIVNNGGGPTSYALALAYGHTSDSLLTNESNVSKSPRFLPLGIQSFSNNAIPGTLAKTLNIRFTSALFLNTNEYLQLIIRFITNNSVPSQQLQFFVNYQGYFE